jgi:hypothetical protein
MKILVFVALLCFGGIQPLGTQEQRKAPFSVGDYFNLCKGIDDTGPETVEKVASHSYCNGFFDGFQAGFFTEQIDSGKAICLPGSGTPDETERVFLKYVRDHPNKHARVHGSWDHKRT